jgi:hypothetical protein
VILFLGLQQEVQGSKELEKYSFCSNSGRKSSFRGFKYRMKNVEILVRTRFRTRNSN